MPNGERKTLLFVVEVKDHLGSPEVKWSKFVNNSARVTATDSLILSM